MTNNLFQRIVSSHALFTGICAFLLLAFVPLALKMSLPPLYIVYALILAALTVLTCHFAHCMCTHHSAQEIAEQRFLKVRLYVSGAGLVLYIGGFGLMGVVAWFFLHTQGDDAGLGEILLPLCIGLLSKIGCFGCLLAALMSRRLRLLLVGSTLISGALILWIIIAVGGIVALILSLILAALIPGILILIGLGVWIYTFYLLTRPCGSPHIPTPTPTHKKKYALTHKKEYTLTLTGDKSHIDLRHEDTPYQVSPSTYATLCRDASSLSASPFVIHSTNEGKEWSMRVQRGAGCTVLYNGREVSHECELASGGTISLQQTTTTPSSKPKSKSRQVVALSIFGDAGHADIFPMGTPHDISSFEYKRVCSDGNLVKDSPYKLTTDDKKSGSMWYITPNNSSAWEVLMDGKPLTGKAHLKIGSTISLRRKGDTKEIARVEVKGRFVYETTPVHACGGTSATHVFGQLRVTITENPV